MGQARPFDSPSLKDRITAPVETPLLPPLRAAPPSHVAVLGSPRRDEVREREREVERRARRAGEAPPSCCSTVAELLHHRGCCPKRHFRRSSLRRRRVLCRHQASSSSPALFLPPPPHHLTVPPLPFFVSTILPRFSSPSSVSSLLYFILKFLLCFS
ncbi:hypothetical protein PIB30_102864 [Stylosanthes scabra]|uniref:Uncharacterized protein n=1 Tax=Stylosanthes scabra TaxID=79078 RepID=A0ABU6TXF3_9FABA|nr:hypothetical protein [Stylosanthes scabra]